MVLEKGDASRMIGEQSAKGITHPNEIPGLWERPALILVSVRPQAVSHTKSFFIGVQRYIDFGRASSEA